MFDNNFNAEKPTSLSARVAAAHRQRRRGRETATLDRGRARRPHVHLRRQRPAAGNLLGRRGRQIGQRRQSARIFEVSATRSRSPLRRSSSASAAPSPRTAGRLRAHVQGGYRTAGRCTCRRPRGAARVRARLRGRGGATPLNVTTHDNFKMSSIPPGAQGLPARREWRRGRAARPGRFHSARTGAPPPPRFARARRRRRR